MPTFNRENLLFLTLSTLANNRFDKNDFEVIVVDDGSTDSSGVVVRSFKEKLNIKYYYQDNKGFRVAKARNEGAKIAEGEVLLFLDCGILLSTYGIEKHFCKHRSEKNVAVIGYVVGYDDFNKHESHLHKLINVADIDTSINEMLKEEVFDMREPLYIEHGIDLSTWPAPWCICWTGNFSVKKEVFDLVGGFDERFQTWGGEDTDLGLNLYTSGVKLVLNKLAVGIHYPHEKEKITVNPTDMKKRTYEKRMYMYNKYLLPEIKLWAENETFDLNRILLNQCY
ncbi:glycosyltransferase [Enterococcus durans]|uniref:glycosyltransferase n=1 Tax=Enterococcus durans TaxID=53345 RepID=UPI002162D780|nr:glycosyltransferase [Enterococcus durans]